MTFGAHQWEEEGEGCGVYTEAGYREDWEGRWRIMGRASYRKILFEHFSFWEQPMRALIHEHHPPQVQLLSDPVPLQVHLCLLAHYCPLLSC